MGWKEYQAQLSERHDFGEFGCPDFEVDLRRIDSFPYGEMKSYTAQTSQLAARGGSGEAAAQTKINDEVLVKCVARWTFTHPKTGEPLPLPAEDAVSLDVLPSEFIAQMHLWLQEDSKLAQLAQEGQSPVPARPRRGSRRKVKAGS